MDQNLEAEFRLYRSVVEMDEHLRQATGDAMTAELLQAMTGMKTMLDSLKTLKGYSDEVEDVQKRGEFMRIIGELSLELAETQIKLSGELRAKEDLERQVKALQAEIKELRTPSIQLIKKGKFYEEPNGEGSYCPQCWEGRKHVSLMSDIGMGNSKCSDEGCGFRDMAGLKRNRPSGGFTI